MRKSYYTEIILLILLSLSAATLAADHHFFEMIGLGEGFETTVGFIRIIAFGAVIIFSIWNVYAHISSPKKIVTFLLASVHNVFFKEVSLNDSTDNRIYRVTCYKYYKFGYVLFSIVFVVFIVLSIIFFKLIIQSNPTEKAILFCILSFIGLICASYLFLNIVDSWWYQFFKRIFISGRRLKIGSNYLLSYARYGYENGERIKTNTTMPVLIDEKKNIYRLFGGTIFNSDKDFESSINNHNINSLLTKLKNSMKFPKVEIDGFHSLVNEKMEDNITALEDRSYFKDGLTADEKEQVKKFMQETSTLSWDLFSINNIRHSNHFVGFKIKNSSDEPWGVVVIDVLSNDQKDFFKYLKIDPIGPNTDANNQQWLDLVLKSFSDIFSKTINPKTDE